MIRNLIYRLFPLPGDWNRSHSYKSRHRGRPALVAAPVHEGATEDWRPIAELDAVALVREPEETAAEAAEREADIVARHWADLEEAAAEETSAEMDALGPKLNPLFAAVDEAYAWAMGQLGLSADEIDAMSARARALHETTTGMPIIRAAVTA